MTQLVREREKTFSPQNSFPWLLMLSAPRYGLEPMIVIDSYASFFFLTSFIVILHHYSFRHTSPWFTVNSRYYDGQCFILFDPEKPCDILFSKVNDPIADANRNLCYRCFYSESQDFSSYFALRS